MLATFHDITLLMELDLSTRGVVFHKHIAPNGAKPGVSGRQSASEAKTLTDSAQPPLETQSRRRDNQPSQILLPRNAGNQNFA